MSEQYIDDRGDASPDLPITREFVERMDAAGEDALAPRVLAGLAAAMAAMEFEIRRLQEEARRSHPAGEEPWTEEAFEPVEWQVDADLRNTWRVTNSTGELARDIRIDPPEGEFICDGMPFDALAPGASFTFVLLRGWGQTSGPLLIRWVRPDGQDDEYEGWV